MSCTTTCVQPSPSNAHCGSCHETLSGVSAFDRHRREGVCLPPGTLGFIRDHRGIWRYPAPDPTKRTIWPQRSDADSRSSREPQATENGSGVPEVTPGAENGSEWHWEPDGNGGWISAPRHGDGTHCWIGPDCLREHA